VVLGARIAVFHWITASASSVDIIVDVVTLD
jgi:hypothetical protein